MRQLLNGCLFIKSPNRLHVDALRLAADKSCHEKSKHACNKKRAQNSLYDRCLLYTDDVEIAKQDQDRHGKQHLAQVNIKAGNRIVKPEFKNIRLTIKPIDEDLVEACARECGKIVTIEEASYVGGLGSAVCEVVAERCPVPVKRIGMPDIFGKSGPGAELLDEFGLSAEHIIEVVKSF